MSLEKLSYDKQFNIWELIQSVKDLRDFIKLLYYLITGDIFPKNRTVNFQDLTLILNSINAVQNLIDEYAESKVNELNENDVKELFQRKKFSPIELQQKIKQYIYSSIAPLHRFLRNEIYIIFEASVNADDLYKNLSDLFDKLQKFPLLTKAIVCTIEKYIRSKLDKLPASQMVDPDISVATRSLRMEIKKLKSSSNKEIDDQLISLAEKYQNFIEILQKNQHKKAINPD